MSEQFRQHVARYSDRELVAVLVDAANYTPESIGIAEEEAELRGGKKALLGRVNALVVREKELRKQMEWITQEIAAGESTDVIVRHLATLGLEGDDVTEAVLDASRAHAEEIRLTTDTGRSSLMAIIGGGIATVVGALYLRFLVFRPEGTVMVFLLGFLFLNVGIVSLFSGDRKTGLVITITVVSMILSVAIGLWLAGQRFVTS